MRSDETYGIAHRSFLFCKVCTCKNVSAFFLFLLPSHPVHFKGMIFIWINFHNIIAKLMFN